MQKVFWACDTDSAVGVCQAGYKPSSLRVPGDPGRPRCPPSRDAHVGDPVRRRLAPQALRRRRVVQARGRTAPAGPPSGRCASQACLTIGQSPQQCTRPAPKPRRSSTRDGRMGDRCHLRHEHRAYTQKCVASFSGSALIGSVRLHGIEFFICS